MIYCWLDDFVCLMHEVRHLFRALFCRNYREFCSNYKANFRTIKCAKTGKKCVWKLCPKREK